MVSMNCLYSIFNEQTNQQQILSNLTLPCDIEDNFFYNVLLMFEEIGEILHTDRRYRREAYRATNNYNEREKISELADLFLIILNLIIYSGYELDTFLDIVQRKQTENLKNFVKTIDNAKNV